MHILSGIGPGTSGVGRLLSGLVTDAEQFPPGDVSLAWRTFREPVLRLLRRGQFRTALSAIAERRHWRRMLCDSALIAADPLVLMHPQSLGFVWCSQLIERRREPTWMYLLDASFFCVRSYNHLPGERSSCTRCLGGDFKSAKAMGCRPEPIRDRQAFVFVRKARDWIAAGRLRCLVQNAKQADMIRQHCGSQAVIEVVGLWTADFNGIRERNPSAAPANYYDVVFHGAPVAAKGVLWALEVAGRCPRLRFLFPHERRQLKAANRAVSANVSFVPMSWESGLADAVASARLVLVPSLWSATIEGALVKSIFSARAVGVVAEPTAFSSELPDGLVLRLPADPTLAAAELQHAIDNHWEPANAIWKNWTTEFQRHSPSLLRRLVAMCATRANAVGAQPVFFGK